MYICRIFRMIQTHSGNELWKLLAKQLQLLSMKWPMNRWVFAVTTRASALLVDSRIETNIDMHHSL